MFVSFGEGAAEDARAGYEDLGYYAVRLDEVMEMLVMDGEGDEYFLIGPTHHAEICVFTIWRMCQGRSGVRSEEVGLASEAWWCWDPPMNWKEMKREEEVLRLTMLCARSNQRQSKREEDVWRM